jgi:hypothetical protein
MISIRKTIVCACALLALDSAPALARTNFNIDINMSPPPARREYVPETRPGYVWAPGYWYWEKGRHNWMKGHWIKERRGYYRVPERWERHGKKWRLRPAHWARGHDRDGHRDRDDNRRDWNDRNERNGHDRR